MREAKSAGPAGHDITAIGAPQRMDVRTEFLVAVEISARQDNGLCRLRCRHRKIRLDVSVVARGTNCIGIHVAILRHRRYKRDVATAAQPPTATYRGMGTANPALS